MIQFYLKKLVVSKKKNQITNWRKKKKFFLKTLIELGKYKTLWKIRKKKFLMSLIRKKNFQKKMNHLIMQIKRKP